MSFATIVNLLTIGLCTAVLIQCWRMTRALQAFREADFPSTVRAMEVATREAEGVLAEIRATLARDAEPKLSTIAEAGQMADELGVMIGIANATADRLLEASRTSRLSEAEMAA